MREEENKFKNIKWVLTILVLSFFLSVIISFISNGIMEATRNIIIASSVVIIIIFINIIFDVLGTAVTAANEVPFRAMASRKMAGAKIAIKMVRKADRVSNVCNDVIGDICGIISGSGAAFIIASMAKYEDPIILTIIGLCITGIVASATVSGKAFGKILAITYSNDIVYFVAKFLSAFVLDRHEKLLEKVNFRKKYKGKV